MYTAIFTSEPETIMYMQLPDGTADVWLRENITETTESYDDFDDDGNVTGSHDVVTWTADEVYFRTTLTLDEVTAQFDDLFENAPELSESEEDGVVVATISTQDRLEAAEEAIAELAELVAEMIG